MVIVLPSNNGRSNQFGLKGGVKLTNQAKNSTFRDDPIGEVPNAPPFNPVMLEPRGCF